MGLFDIVHDWNLVKKQKAGFLEALRMTPVGACISIKDPHNRITARAIIELLRDHPNEVEVMDFGFEVTLMRKVGMVQSMTKGSYEHLRDNHQILSADSLVTLGLKNKDQLPPRKYREGVPDTINGEGGLEVSESTVETDIKVER